MKALLTALSLLLTTVLITGTGWRSASATHSQPAAPPRSAQSARPSAPVEVLLVPDSGADRIMALDPYDGHVIDANLIPADPTHLSTPKSALATPDGMRILVSDQLDDVVQQYDLAGNYLGVFAPAGGANNQILDNITGIAWHPNGHLLVPVGSSQNAGGVAEFDQQGNYVGNFIAPGTGGLDSPFDIYQRSTDWLVSDSGSDVIRRYDLTTGASLGTFALINNFPQQITEAYTNVLIANFNSTTATGIQEFTAAGVFVGRYDPLALTGNYRGVYQLGNGNILVADGTGVSEIDRSNNLIERKITGVSAQYIDLAQLAVINLEATQRALRSTAWVNQPLSYTLTVSNTGLVTATNVILSDSLSIAPTMVLALPSQGSCGSVSVLSGTASFTCSLGILPPNASASIELHLTPALTGTISNTISVSSPTFEVMFVDNSATLITEVIAPTQIYLPLVLKPEDS